LDISEFTQKTFAYLYIHFSKVFFFLMFLKEVSCAHQGYIYLIKKENVYNFKKLFSILILFKRYFCGGKAECSPSLLQSSLSHQKFTSEIILICNISRYYQCWKWFCCL